MKLTTKGRYAVTAMLDLAIHGASGPVCLADIAARQDISLSYLEQLFTRLRKRGLVLSTRGPGGGYQLCVPAAQVSVAEVVAAVDESLDTTRCAGERDCQNGERCLTHQLWEDLGSHIHAYLSGITLAALAERGDVRKVAERQKEQGIRISADIPLRNAAAK